MGKKNILISCVFADLRINTVEQKTTWILMNLGKLYYREIK